MIKAVALETPYVRVAFLFVEAYGAHASALFAQVELGGNPADERGRRPNSP